MTCHSHTASDGRQEDGELDVLIDKGLILHYYVYSSQDALKNYAPCCTNQSFTKVLRKLVLILSEFKTGLLSPPLPRSLQGAQVSCYKGARRSTPQGDCQKAPLTGTIRQCQDDSAGISPSLALFKLFSVKDC